MNSLLKSLSEARIRRREERIRDLLRERDVREQAVFAQVPRLAEIKAELARLGLEMARLALGVADPDQKLVGAITARTSAILAEREQLLRRHRIDARQLEVQWDCPECRNTGWLEPPVSPGQVEVRPATKCHCLLRGELEDLFRISGLTPPLREQTFANFHLDVYPPTTREYMSRLHERCRQFARAVAMGQETENLLFIGAFGLGKTFLATAVANQVVAKRKVGVYFTFPDFLDMLRRHRFDDDGESWDEAQRLLRCDLLVLDDLGTEKLSEWAAQELFSVVNHRIIRNLPMVFVSNLTLPELREWYGERIFSRIVGHSQILEFRGEDIRLARRLPKRDE